LPTEPITENEVPLDLPIPFPGDKQLFLIKKHASVIIMPRRLCADSCRLTLFKDEIPVGLWNFAKDTAPLVKLPITTKDVGHYRVTLEYGARPESNTEFEVNVFSPTVFEKAIKAGRSVELLD
jgi:hypothetical protein